MFRSSRIPHALNHRIATQRGLLKIECELLKLR